MDEYQDKTYMKALTIQHVLDLQKINPLGVALTGDYVDLVARNGVKVGAARQRLRRIAQTGLIKRVIRGAYQVTPKGYELLESVTDASE